MADKEGKKRGKQEVTYRGSTTTGEVAAYLQALVDGLKSGTICVQRGEDHLSLRPAGELELEVSARRKGRRESFRLALSWRPPEPGAVGSHEPLKILSRDPEPADEDAGE